MSGRARGFAPILDVRAAVAKAVKEAPRSRRKPTPLPSVETTKAEAEANARLIAAAPEMLEALKYARRFLKTQDADTAFVDAAIAKAEGRS